MPFHSRVTKKPIRRRNYAAAKIDRLTSSWTTTSLTADETLESRLKVLVARSREQVENNDYAKRFINLVKSNVVGPKGITFQAKTERLNGEQDEPANKALEAAWKKQCKLGNFDITGMLSYKTALDLLISTVATDGEVLVREITGRQTGDSLYSLQFIDTQLLDAEYKRELTGGRFIRMGIEFNKFSRPIAYHVIDVGNQASSYGYNGKRYLRIPADQIIHRFLPEKIGQKRGIPWTATSMLRMQMLNGFEEASLVNARTGASKMGFYMTKDGAQYSGDDVDANGNAISDAEAGTFETLPSNIVDFKSFDPQYPNGEFKDFMKTCLRGISGGLNVSYYSLANDLEDVNFSSIRTGVLEDREAWKALQEWVIESFCTPVYEAWLSVQLQFGLIKINGTPLRADLEEKYKKVVWMPRRWAWVDPKKDAEEKVLLIDNNIEPVSDVIRERGKDPDEVFNQIAIDKKKMEELGITKEEVINNLASVKNEE